MVRGTSSCSLPLRMDVSRMYFFILLFSSFLLLFFLFSSFAHFLLRNFVFLPLLYLYFLFLSQSNELRGATSSRKVPTQACIASLLAKEIGGSSLFRKVRHSDAPPTENKPVTLTDLAPPHSVSDRRVCRPAAHRSIYFSMWAAMFGAGSTDRNVVHGVRLVSDPARRWCWYIIPKRAAPPWHPCYSNWHPTRRT